MRTIRGQFICHSYGTGDGSVVRERLLVGPTHRATSCPGTVEPERQGGGGDSPPSPFVAPLLPFHPPPSVRHRDQLLNVVAEPRDGANLRDSRPLVLVVDDEESYRQALASGLSQEGFSVECAADGHEAMRLFHRIHPDLVLVDVMLPDQSGVELCQRMRALAPVPIIMVTAKDSEVDVVLGLELGASDYVPKPFRLRELVARMRAVLRRGVASSAVGNDEVVHAGPIRLDNGRREVTVDGNLVELSRKEFDLLALLMSHAGQVVTRDRCIDRLWWDQDLADTRTLDTHMKRLRRKIERDPANPRHLVTVRGVGFRFEG